MANKEKQVETLEDGTEVEMAFENVGVSWYTSANEKKIKLPKDMELAEGIVHLERQRKESFRVVSVNEPFDCLFTEGAHGLAVVLKGMYGWTNLIPTPSFWGPEPPQQVGIRSGVGKTDQVPWGRMQIPGVHGFLATGIRWVKGVPYFALEGNVQRRSEKEVAKIASALREYLKENSLYKGKALRIPEVDDEEAGAWDYEPEFMRTDGIQKDDLIFGQEVETLIHANLFTPVEHAEACKAAGIPLKRGVLLAGPYGVGKTLSARALARTAVENGWTFLYIDHPKDLASTIKMARMYAPAVVFAEDIDSVLDGRDDKANEILNTIDGIDAKATDIMVVLTTNHVENITPAMLRPGRLDAVIHVDPPKADAAERLVRAYTKGRLDADADLTQVGKALAGRIPAVIREICERAKLYAINSGQMDGALTPQALLDAAIDAERQIELLNPKAPDHRDGVQKGLDNVATALREYGLPMYVTDHDGKSNGTARKGEHKRA